jgi:purine nucleoside phosphorylase
MFEPFCNKLTNQLCLAARKMPFEVKENATYVSFYGYPRIETKAELEFYNRQGWDVVGQTCDPEATLARLNQLCYAGVAVQIDDPSGRADYINGLKKNKKVNAYVESISSCRERTTKIILQFLKDYKGYNCEICSKMARKNNNFREFPDSFYE